MSDHVSFPSIGSLASVLKDLQYILAGETDYLGVVKLDGSNLSVVAQVDGRLHFQSREMLIPLDGAADVYGFRATMANDARVAQLQRAFRAVAALAESHPDRPQADLFPITVYGEWAGNGVTRRTPVGQLPTAWYPFAIRFGDFDTESSDKPIWTDQPFQIACINAFVSAIADPSLVRSIFDYPTVRVLIDPQQPELAQTRIERLLEPVELQCPLATVHGLQGGGEGWVFRPLGPLGRNARYWFKAKTRAHLESKHQPARTLSEAELSQRALIEKFVRDNLPEARLERGLRHLAESGQPLSKASTGGFVRWLIQDVVKEHADWLTAHGMAERDLSTPIARIAGPWFVHKLT